MKFCTDIHGPQRTIPLAPPTAQSCHLSREISQNLQNDVQKILHRQPCLRMDCNG